MRIITFCAPNNDEYKTQSKLFKDQNKHRSKNTKDSKKIKLQISIGECRLV